MMDTDIKKSLMANAMWLFGWIIRKIGAVAQLVVFCLFVHH